jgi:hypothetical protein
MCAIHIPGTRFAKIGLLLTFERGDEHGKRYETAACEHPARHCIGERSLRRWSGPHAHGACAVDLFSAF